MAGEERPEVWWDDERTAQWAAEQGLCITCHHPSHDGRCGAFLGVSVSGAAHECDCGYRTEKERRWVAHGELRAARPSLAAREPLPRRGPAAVGGRGETQPPRAAGATHDFHVSAPLDGDGVGTRHGPSLDVLVMRCCLHAVLWAWLAPRLFPDAVRTPVEGGVFGAWYGAVSWSLDRWLPYSRMRGWAVSVWHRLAARRGSQKRQ